MMLYRGNARNISTRSDILRKAVCPNSTNRAFFTRSQRAIARAWSAAATCLARFTPGALLTITRWCREVMLGISLPPT